MGGTTRSSDFGPATSPYGFLYAINLEGDWKWGHYFRNFTGNINQITGCSLSTDKTQVIVLGTTKDQVVTAVVNTTTGRIANLYSLSDYKVAKKGGLPPDYRTYGAVMLDSEDPRDRKAYIYASFLKDDLQQVVKILQAVPDKTNEFPEIKYHYSM